MRSSIHAVVKKHLLRWALGIVVILGLIGHALAEDVASTSREVTRNEKQHPKLEPTLAKSVVRIEVVPGETPFWQWPVFDAWRSILGQRVERAQWPVLDTAPLSSQSETICEQRESELVAGFFVDKRHVLTVLSEDPGLAAKFRVTLGKDSLEATMKARDPESGLTLLEVENSPANTAPITFGDGDVSFAAVPAAAGVNLASLVQNEKDAREGSFGASEALLPGTPVVTENGMVVGVVRSTTPTFSMAPFLGIATPVRLYAGRMIRSDVLPDMARQLETRGEVARGWLGASVRSLDLFEQIPVFAAGRRSGLCITSIEPGSPASKAGLVEDDVIVSFDGKPCGSPCALDRRLAAAGPGKHVKLEVLRESRLRVIETDLGEVPSR